MLFRGLLYHSSSAIQLNNELRRSKLLAQRLLDEENATLSNRRVVMGVLASSISCLGPPLEAKASPLVLRSSAANMPGYGPPDVLFPNRWVGSWNVNREIVAEEGSEPIRVQYNMRFISSDLVPDSVIADRGSNQVSLEESLSKVRSVRSCKWEADNPNVLRLEYTSGERKEVKVTKRSTETTDDTVSSSEFQRVTQDDGRGIPTVTARRVLTKWKEVNPERIEGLEIVYDMGMGGDPLAAAPGNSKPVLLSKSRLTLQRR